MKFRLIAAAAALFAGSGTAEAAIINYNVVGPLTASFSVDTAAPRCSTTTLFFTYCGVNATINGAAFNNANLTFGADPFAGVSLYAAGTSLPVYDFTGAALFTGTVANPTLSLGTFTLTATNLSSGGVPINSAPRGTYTINAAIAAAVPEPATWALMIAGFGLTGAAMRRRRRQGIVAA